MAGTVSCRPEVTNRSTDERRLVPRVVRVNEGRDKKGLLTILFLNGLYHSCI